MLSSPFKFPIIIPRIGFHFYPFHHAQPLLMPALSPTMTEGAIVKWNIEQGTGFNAGDVLFQVETDKAQLEVDAQEDGVLAKILVSAGSKGVAVNSVIAVLAEQGEDLTSINLDQLLSNTKTKLAQASTAPSIPITTTSVLEQSKHSIRPPHHHHHQKKSNKPVHFSPAVARIMHEYKIDRSTVLGIKATGPQARILKSDILSYIKTQNLKRPKVIHPEPIVPVSNKESLISKQSTIKKPNHLLNIMISYTQYCHPIDTRVVIQDALKRFVKTNDVTIVIDNSLHLGKSDKVVYLKMDGVDRRAMSDPEVALTSSQIEGQFYDYLAGGHLFEPSSSIKVRDDSTQHQDMYEYLAGQPLLTDTRFQFVYRVSVMQLSGFANDKDSDSVVAQINSVVHAALASP